MSDNLLDSELKALMAKHPDKQPKHAMEDPVDASWAPEREGYTWEDIVKAVVISFAVYGPLVWLVFYFQQHQLMDYNTANWCMMGLCLAAGLSIGKRAMSR